MFVSAIETASKYTRPIHLISRTFGSKAALPGSATLFIVNDQGWGLTCRHVGESLLAARGITDKYKRFKDEREQINPSKKARNQLNSLERRYDYSRGVAVEMYVTFMNCVEGTGDFDIKFHDSIDLALIRFTNFTKLLVDTFPIFAKDGNGLKPGKSIWRLGNAGDHKPSRSGFRCRCKCNESRSNKASA